MTTDGSNIIIYNIKKGFPQTHKNAPCPGVLAPENYALGGTAGSHAKLAGTHSGLKRQSTMLLGEILTSVDGQEVGVFKHSNEEVLGGLLKHMYRVARPSQVRLEVLTDFTHQSLEGQLSNQQFG